MATINELVTELGFKVDEQSQKRLNDFSKQIDGLTKGFTKIGQFFTGGKSTKDFLFGTAKESTQLLNTAKRIGMTTEAIQKWQYAAKSFGVSADGVISGLEDIKSSIGWSDKAVLNLAKSFQKMNAFTAKKVGQSYGLNDDLILLLRKGPEAIKKAMDEAKESGGIIDDTQLQKLDTLNKKLETTKTNIENITKSIIADFSPQLIEYLNKFSEWIKSTENQEKVINTIKGALQGLVATEILNGLSSLVVLIAGLVKGVKALGSAAIFLTSGGLLNFLKGAATAGTAATAGSTLAGSATAGTAASAGIGALGKAGIVGATLAAVGSWGWYGYETYKGKKANEERKRIFSEYAETLKKRATQIPNIESGKRSETNSSIMTGNGKLNTNGTNIGEINISIVTSQAADEIVKQLQDFGVKATNGVLSYNTMS